MTTGYGVLRLATAPGLMSATSMIIRTVAATAAAAVTAAAVVYLSHASAVDLITQAGLTWWSSGNCDDRHRPECTSFEGIRQTTIDGVITLKRASGCPVNVTGGTETGHGKGGAYTHWDGWKVDISKGACIDGYITNAFSYLGYVSGWGHQYRSPAGNVYTDEGDHWDILYHNCGGCDEPWPSPSASPLPSVAPTPTESPSPLSTLDPTGAETGHPPRASGVHVGAPRKQLLFTGTELAEDRE